VPANYVFLKISIDIVEKRKSKVNVRSKTQLNAWKTGFPSFIGTRILGLRLIPNNFDEKYVV